jgi:hypothetical protein
MNASDYAKRAKTHLLRHRPRFAAALEREGRLDANVRELGEEAQEQEEAIERDYLKKNPPPESYLERAAHLARARSAAEEIVLHELKRRWNARQM